MKYPFILSLKKSGTLLLSTLVLGTLSACGGSSGDSTEFLVRIENIGAGAITTSEGTVVPAVFAPGAAIVNLPGVSGLFVTGEPSSAGLEIMAEDGGGMLLAEEADSVEGVMETVTFGVPEGADGPGPITPGNSYTFTVSGQPGENLNLATMFVQSNDIFVAPVDEGIALFDENGEPRFGDVTSEMLFWDGGTEVNQEIGLGSDQAPRQAGPNTGQDENGVVTVFSSSNIPELTSVIRITLSPS